MNRKKLPTVVACVVLAAMLLFSGVYAAVDAGWFRRESDGEAPVFSGQETPPPPSSSAQEDLPSMYRFVNTAAGEFLPKPDVFEDEEGRTITTDRFRFTVDAVYVAKDTQGLPPPRNLLNCDGPADENGTLIGDKSYFFMDITLENRTNLVVDLGLSWLKPVFYAGDMELDMDTSGEIALQSINNDVPVKSMDLYTLQPNATVHYTVAYVVEDEKIAEVTDVFALFSTKSVYRRDGDLCAWQPWVTFINMTPLWQAWKE